MGTASWISTEDGPGPLSRMEECRHFRSTLDERCDEPPTMTELREVGSFRFP